MLLRRAPASMTQQGGRQVEVRTIVERDRRDGAVAGEVGMDEDE